MPSCGRRAWGWSRAAAGGSGPRCPPPLAAGRGPAGGCCLCRRRQPGPEPVAVGLRPSTERGSDDAHRDRRRVVQGRTGAHAVAARRKPRGSSKVPARPDGATHLREGFFDHRRCPSWAVPFPGRGGRAFPAAAPLGLTFLRLLVTWKPSSTGDRGSMTGSISTISTKWCAGRGSMASCSSSTPTRMCGAAFRVEIGAPGWTLGGAGLDMNEFRPHRGGHRPRHPRRSLSAHDLADERDQAGGGHHVQLFFGGNDFARKRGWMDSRSRNTSRAATWRPSKR